MKVSDGTYSNDFWASIMWRPGRRWKRKYLRNDKMTVWSCLACTYKMCITIILYNIWRKDIKYSICSIPTAGLKHGIISNLPIQWGQTLLQKLNVSMNIVWHYFHDLSVEGSVWVTLFLDLNYFFYSLQYLLLWRGINEPHHSLPHPTLAMNKSNSPTPPQPSLAMNRRNSSIPLVHL